jgi:diguanylate cyclase (GGDEF)-like protein
VTWAFAVFSWGFVYQIVGISFASLERFVRADALPISVLLLLVVTCAFLRREAGHSIEQWSEDALTLCVVLVYPQEVAAALAGLAAMLVAVSQLASRGPRSRDPWYRGAWHLVVGEVAFHGGLMAFVTLTGSVVFRLLYGDDAALTKLGPGDLWRIPLVFAALYFVRLGILFVHSWSRGLPLEEFGRSLRSLRSVRAALAELANLLLGVSMAVVYTTLGLPVFVALGGAYASAVALLAAEARVRRELEARVVELRVLNAVGRALADAPSREAVIAALVERGRALFGADTLALHVSAGSGLAGDAIREADGRPLVPASSVLSDGVGLDVYPLAEWCARNERSLRLDRVSVSAAAYGIDVPGAPAVSWLGVPLETGGRTEGVLSVASARASAFSEQHEELLGALGRQAVTALRSVLLHEIATVDALTGLLTSRHLRERLSEEFARARASGRPLGVVMLDIDRFKEVNDTYGHEIGNEVLRHLARLVVGKLRETDIAARYGGEEFTILLPGTPAPAAAEVAERLRVAVEATPAETLVGPLTITASFGIATFPNVDAASGDDLLAAADAALYESKRAGRNRLTEARNQSGSR